MEQRQPIFQLSLGAKGAIAILLLAVSSSIVLTSCNPNAPETSVPTTQPTQPLTTPTPNTQTETTKAEIYLVEDNNGKLELIPRPITVEQKATNQEAVLEQSFNRLLVQSDGNAIPQGTKLRSIKVDKDSITVDLSPEFTSGGGSFSMKGRLGQVIYTATSLNPKAKVFLSVNGQPLDTLGGEGLEISQPMTRESFQQDFPQ
jgi:spore germination protein GerM